MVDKCFDILEVISKIALAYTYIVFFVGTFITIMSGESSNTLVIHEAVGLVIYFVLSLACAIKSTIDYNKDFKGKEKK